MSARGLYEQCIVVGCRRKRRARKLCSTHYSYMRRGVLPATTEALGPQRAMRPAPATVPMLWDGAHAPQPGQRCPLIATSGPDDPEPWLLGFHVWDGTQWTHPEIAAHAMRTAGVVPLAGARSLA